jgi:hypothetical protein
MQENLGAAACSNNTDISYTGSCAANTGGDAGTFAPTTHAPGANVPFNHGANGNSGVGTVGPHANSSPFVHKGGVVANFAGISDVASHAVNGFHITPPDQALCVGLASPWEAAGLKLGVAPGTTVVVEGDNEAWAIYSTSGATLFGPDTLADLFSDPFASGDIGCRYDPATQSYFFTEIGGLLFGSDAGNFGTDLAVFSPNGYAPYQVDTSVGATCFPDFPQLGFDPAAFYLSIDAFCGPNQDFAGTDLYAITKADLVALGAAGFVAFGPLALAGDPVLALQPASGDASSTEYLVNSWAYDASGNNLATANTLGLWQVTGDQNIDSAPGTVTLTGQTIASETYAFPVPAASTGDGNTPAGSPNFVIAEQFLNPDDSRAEQVQITNTNRGLRLYTSLDTALYLDNSFAFVDGAAWFEIDPVGQKVTQQGYVGVAGTNLLYPSLMRTSSGEMVLDFSMTSPTLNPSTGYAVAKDTSGHFGAVQMTQEGSGPHVSFSDLLFNRPRWGDYSAAALDPNGNDVWVADEDVPAGPDGADAIDNWGTQVWAVSGGK